MIDIKHSLSDNLGGPLNLLALDTLAFNGMRVESRVYHIFTHLNTRYAVLRASSKRDK